MNEFDRGAVERGDRFARTAIVLVKEYIGKLQAYRIEFLKLQSLVANEQERWTNETMKKKNARYLVTQRISFTDLERQLVSFGMSCSQHVEHGAGSDEILLELKVRLAEFERELALTRVAV